MKAAGLDPPALKNRPVLDDRLSYYRRAFNRLSKARQWTGAAMSAVPQPITVAEVLAYCELMQIRGVDLRDRLLTHIQSLDEAWRARWFAKNTDS